MKAISNSLFKTINIKISFSYIRKIDGIKNMGTTYLRINQFEGQL
jgi:hypothetical protein